MKKYLEKLVACEDLEYAQATEAMETIMSGKASDSEIAGFLTALRMKGESAGEISAFASVMRDHCIKVQPKVDGPIIDVVGTGGDGKSTFNISTASMFVLSASGVYVAKHGNRSITSKSGSADVLEALGAEINLKPEDIKSCIQSTGVGFMYAPNHHPSMKHVMNVRKCLGFRTVFNILGPITNPAQVKAQVIGVFDPNLTETLAEVLKKLGTEHAMIVHGYPGIDELSNIGETKITELKKSKIETYTLNPNDLGLDAAQLSDLTGSGPVENARLIREILSGKIKGPQSDAVALNAAAGFVVSEKAKTLQEGFSLAEYAIESGDAIKKLDEYIRYTKKCK
jgi:anthranilate phosphoribosyltransferase